MASELPPVPELEVNRANWDELYDLGFRHFLNIAPERLSEPEFLDLVAFAKRAAGGDEHFAFGAVYDDVHGPLDTGEGLGLYVRRPQDWAPI
jgi:hypothetical protein